MRTETEITEMLLTALTDLLTDFPTPIPGSLGEDRLRRKIERADFAIVMGRNHLDLLREGETT